MTQVLGDQRTQRRAASAKRRVRWAALVAFDRLRTRSARTGDRRVLLYAQNSLMADYLLLAWESIRNVPGLDGVVTEFPEWNETYSSRASSLGLRSVRRTLALSLDNWDLVLLADHAPLTFPPSTRQLILPHGPGPSRTVRGGSYYYDRARCFWPNGQLVYELMLDTSYFAIEAARQWVPEYADRIRVVGDLRADALVGHMASAPQRRQDLGWGNRRVVAVMSTWGPHGLMRSHSEWLLPRLLELTTEGDLAVVFTMHQELWSGSDSDGGRWANVAEDIETNYVRVVRPGDALEPELSLADFVISDHTSLAMTVTALNVPIIPVAVDPEVLVEGSFSRALQERRLALKSVGDLDVALGDLSRYGTDDLPRVLDHIGECGERTRAAITEVLFV